MGFGILGLGLGWALDRFGWSEAARARRPDWASAVVPALGGAGFVAASVVFDSAAVALIAGAFVAVMAALGVIDAVSTYLPNRITYPAFVAFVAALVVAAIVLEGIDPVQGVIGAAVYGGAILVMYLASRGQGMAFGDVKLAVLIGFVLGSLLLRAVWIAALAGAIAGGVGGVIALTVFRMGRKAQIPYGPFLAAGAILATLLIPQL